MGVGAFLPWMAANSYLGSANMRGTETTQGKIMVGIAIVTGLLIMAVGRDGATPAIGGALIAGWRSILAISDVHHVVSSNYIPIGVTAKVGFGLYVCLGGAVLLLIGGLVLAANKGQEAQAI